VKSITSAHLKKITRPNYTKLSAHVASGRGLVFL